MARAKLGDCEFERDGNGWKLLRNGKMVVTGLTLQQMLAIIRGEVRVTDLKNGTEKYISG